MWSPQNLRPGRCSENINQHLHVHHDECAQLKGFCEIPSWFQISWNFVAISVPEGIIQVDRVKGELRIRFEISTCQHVSNIRGQQILFPLTNIQYLLISQCMNICYSLCMRMELCIWITRDINTSWTLKARARITLSVGLHTFHPWT
jgi:hypothetical protein